MRQIIAKAMRAEDTEISTRLVLILLVPVIVVLALFGYVIVDSLTASQPPANGPDSSVVFEDHPDRLNRSAPGEGIVNGTLEGEEALNWSHLVIEIINPRSDEVVVSLSASNWTAQGAGQTLAVHANGTVPQQGETLTPGGTFILRDVHDDRGPSQDLINPCDGYVFRAKHDPTDTVLGTFETRFVTSDWVPGQSCDDVSG